MIKIKDWLKDDWKKIVIIFIVALVTVSFILFSFSGGVSAAVRVKGYFRKDGTYVSPHYRSNPDGNPYNNWSFPGNVNPYTGEVAPGNPDTYLKNYYGSSGGSSNSSYGSSEPSQSAGILNQVSGLSNFKTIPTYHYIPLIWKYRLFKVDGSLTVWELSDWQPAGFGTRKAFSNPQSFENRYGKSGWLNIKPISTTELNKYQEFPSYW